jgi:hypothetical protein
MAKVVVAAPERIGQRQDLGAIGGQIAEKAGQDLPGRPGQDHEKQQHDRQDHVDLGQALDPFLDAQHHRGGGDGGDDDDQHDLGRVRRAPAEQEAEAGGGLLGADPQRGGQPEERRHHRQHIDDMARPAPDPLAQDRIKDRAQRQRQPLVIGKERQRQRHHRIDRPGVQAPVEDRRGHRQPAGAQFVARRAVQRRPVGADPVFDHRPAQGGGEMAQRLADAIEHQADAHARGKKHGKPARQGEIRRRLGAAQPDRAQRRQDQAKAQQHEDIAGDQEEPVEIAGDHVAQAGKEGPQHRGEQQGRPGEQHDGRGRDHEDRVVDVIGDGLHALDIVLADLVFGRDDLGGALGQRQGLDTGAAILLAGQGVAFRLRLVVGWAWL